MGEKQKKKKSDSLADVAFSSLVWKFGERFFAQAVSFVVSVVLARILAPSDYGVIAIVLVFIVFADVFVSSGFGTALIQKKDANMTDFSTIFYCSLVVSLIAYIFLFFCAPFIASFYEMPILTPVIRVFSLRLPIASYQTVQHAYVSRHMQFKKFFLSTIIGTFISGVVGIVLAMRGFGVWALVAQYLTNIIVDTIVLSFTIKWHPKLVFSRKSAKELMGFGWRVLAADFSGTFFEQLRSIIIGKVYSSVDLAFYDKGRTFSSLLTDNLNSSIMAVLFPAMANKNDSVARVKSIAKRAISMIAFVLAPVLLGCVAVADSLIQVIFTDKWAPSVPFLRILCISNLISIIGSVSLQVLRARGEGKRILRLELIKKPVYFLLLIIGVKINVVAVAVTMMLYSIYATIINARSMQKSINYSLIEQIKDIAPSIIMAIIMSTVVTLQGFLPLDDFAKLVIQVTTGISAYLSMAVLTKNKSLSFLSGYLKGKLFRK